MDEFIVETPEAGESPEQIEIRLATVAEVTSDGLRLQFDEASAATDKVYKCNASCIFLVGDRVKVTKHSGTYLVDYVIGGPGEDGHGIPTGGASGQVLRKQSEADYAVEWATPHYVPSGGSEGQLLGKSSDVSYALEWKTPHYVPSGGSSGQALRKSSGNDYAIEWAAVHEIPNGGSSGQILGKASSANYDVSWVDAHGIPTGGAAGQVLAKSSAANYAVSWADAHGIPTGGTAGQVLAKSSSTNYAVTWVDISASKLKSGTYEVALSSTTLTPNSSAIALGSSSKPFGDLYAQGTVSLGANYKAITIGTANSTLGFFGHTAASRQTVASTATVATLITALKAYGLIL